jgi:hypothetical protein
MVEKRGMANVAGKSLPMPVQENNSTEKILIENFIALQRVMTNLIVKVDSLSGQMSKLLELFESSARSLSEKGYSETKTDPKIAEKLNNLVEQNKVIAKGVAMLYEKNNPEEENAVEKNIPAPQYMPSQQIQQRPAQRPPVDFSKIQKFGNF